MTAGSINTNQKGFIIAETNYRIYAYTGKVTFWIDCILMHVPICYVAEFYLQNWIRIQYYFSNTVFLSIFQQNQICSIRSWRCFVICCTGYIDCTFYLKNFNPTLYYMLTWWILRFPNVIVGQLTKESVQTAISNGITANQILHYLRSHAHPDMLKNVRIWFASVRFQIFFQLKYSNWYSATYSRPDIGRSGTAVGIGTR